MFQCRQDTYTHTKHKSHHTHTILHIYTHVYIHIYIIYYMFYILYVTIPYTQPIHITQTHTHFTQTYLLYIRILYTHIPHTSRLVHTCTHTNVSMRRYPPKLMNKKVRNFLFKIIHPAVLFYVHRCFVCMSVCYVCVGCSETRRGYQIPQD